jgi:Ca-activated chloride channel family protein
MTTTNAIIAKQDRRLIRAVHHSSRYVLVEVAAPPALPSEEKAARPNVNVAFVLDRSGSMGGEDKFPLAAQAVRHGIERLAPTDRFCVVAFDHEIDVVAAAQAATSGAKSDAIAALATIGPRGNTNLSGGWLRGAEQVASAIDRDGVNRVLLLTDGQANLGITDPASLQHHAAELRARGVNTSTFGVGEDFDEALLGGMADAGGGAFRFIAKPDEIPELIGSEVGELLDVTAKDARLSLAGPAGLRVGCLSPFPVEQAGSGWVLSLGDLVADQVVRLVLKLGFPLGEAGRETGVVLEVGDRGGRLTGSETLTWAFADGAANDAQPRDRDVDRVVARTYADRALRDVVNLNRRGDWEASREALLAIAKRIRSYAGSDEVLRGIVHELEREAENWSRMRSELERKQQYSSSTYALKARMLDGSATRRPRRDDPNV